MSIADKIQIDLSPMKPQEEEKPEITETVTPTSVVTPDARIRGL